MKNKILILIALIALPAFAQVPRYALQTLQLGTSNIDANTQLDLPYSVEAVTTNQVVTRKWLTLTNTLISSNLFTLPATNWLNVTNVFTTSNSVVSLGTNTFYVSKTITNANPTAYYVTNAAYVTSYYSTNYTTNVVIGVTNVYTWRTNIAYVTNSASISTNYQTFIYTTLVPFVSVCTNLPTLITNTTTYQNVLNLRGSASAGIAVQFALSDSGTNDVTFTTEKSIDGQFYTDSSTFTITSAGTTTVGTNINLDMGPFAYYRFTSITNGNATNVVNLSIKSAQKIQSP